MSELPMIRNCKFLGEVPQVFVQSPMIQTSPHCVKCTGCENVVHCLEPEKAICPYCVSQEINSLEPTQGG